MSVLVTGYTHPLYAESLGEFGNPIELSQCGGWILDRQIPGFSYHDAFGCYPLFACQYWSKLDADLREINGDLVSLSLVTDPFGEYDSALLKQCFKDVIIPFKKHFCVDLNRPIDSFVCRHHQRYARKALRVLHVEKCQDSAQCVDDWVKLYECLIRRHRITGIAAFSRTAFIKQFEVPGLVAFRALHHGTLVGMLLWYVQGKVGYYHLGAYSSLGYNLRASFALFWWAIVYFGRNGLKWLALGAGAGVESNATEGLSRFKKGWSTGTRTAYFCGRIFDHAKYSEIVRAKGISISDYFPAYRKGEFR